MNKIMSNRYFLTMLIGLVFLACAPTQTVKEPTQTTEEMREKAVQEYSIGYEYLKQRKYDEAIIHFEEAIKLDPKYYAAYIALAKTYRTKRDIVTAESFYNQAKKIEPQDTRAYEGIATIYFVDYRNYDKAIAEFIRGLQVDSTDVDLLNGLAASYTKKKEYDKALKYYKKSLEYEPENIEAMFAIANVYMEKNESDKAISYLQELIIKKPKNIEVREKLAETLVDLKRYNEAVEQYKYLIEQKPDNYNYHLKLGLVYKLQKKYTNAEKEFKDAKRLAPNNTSPLFHLADLNITLKKYVAAENFVNEALKLEPNSIYAQVLFGDIYERRGYAAKSKWDKNKSKANVPTAKTAINLLKKAKSFYTKAKADPQYSSYAGTEIVRCNNWIGQLQEDVWFYEGKQK